MVNPFMLRGLPPAAPFCDRTEELSDLETHVTNKANVVVFSPRRFGKTSLVRRLQAQLAEKNIIPFYIDLFMVTSPEDVAQRLAKSIYTILHRRESLLKKGVRYLKIFKTFRPVFKPSAQDGVVLSVEAASPGLSGMERLEEVMGELGRFIEREESGIHVVLDEFQEITELKKTPVEGLLRTHIQEHRASYFFVGSRRRILLDMFNRKNRPFYQSAIMYPLKALPKKDLIEFLREEFGKGGTECSEEMGDLLFHRTSGYPYYVQALAYYVFVESKRRVTEKSVEAGFTKLLASERYGFEALIQGLSGGQIALLRALAADPRQKLLSTEFMNRHKLSIGGIQSAQKKLVDLDLIENDGNGWRLVDPLFRLWVADY